MTDIIRRPTASQLNLIAFIETFTNYVFTGNTFDEAIKFIQLHKSLANYNKRKYEMIRRS